MSSKRTLEGFFASPTAKKTRINGQILPQDFFEIDESIARSSHSTYPFPVPHLPQSLREELGGVPSEEGKDIHNQPDLDLLYFRPYISREIANRLFLFLRQELFFYRVQYQIKRFGKDTQINTPRFTTVFGVDITSRFTPEGQLVDTQSQKAVPAKRYACTPRPIPECLDFLRRLTEVFTGAEYNFCLVNYYASGVDSISYHSDDEHFLGPNPSIASLSLGASRDFCMKHKPPPKVSDADQALSPKKNSEANLKLPLESGDMILMRGPTQAHWLHSIPKRAQTTKTCSGGRINITFRKGIKPYATENYMQYNVGSGPAYRWSPQQDQMVLWSPNEDSRKSE